MMRMKNLLPTISLVSLPFLSGNIFALSLEELAEENRKLRERIEKLEAKEKITEQKVEQAVVKTAEPRAETVKEQEIEKKSKNSDEDKNYLLVDHQYSYEVLDPLTDINRKQEAILSKLKTGELKSDSFYVSAAITPIANYQKSNTESKFGYLMRHPTSNNQRTKTVSEAVIHSAQLAVSGNLNSWITAYIEMLYDPQQSFGAGTTTDLNRNQVQVRYGYLLLGDLNRSPFYMSIGKMAVPFGLTDTPNPFTASTVWHAFGGLAYGLNTGYSNGGLNIRLMGVQGGAQFRSANVPVDKTSTPSKINNYAADINYTFGDTDSVNFLIGASYIKGSAYCQDFPVTHFSPCQEANGAYDLYAQFNSPHWMLQVEYAQTNGEWPGTFNSTIPQFEASDVTSWDIGGQYKTHFGDTPIDFSLDYSRFEAGPNGAPWEKQDQIIAGFASWMSPSSKFFVEVIQTEGYVPLNFISGGNLGSGATHSEAGASSTTLMMGANVAF